MDDHGADTPESPNAVSGEPLHMTVDMEANKYSQSGEDGIIARILSEWRIELARVCVEIGANDGFHLSNVASLREQGWPSILVESNSTHEIALRSLRWATAIIQEVTPENVVEIIKPFIMGKEIGVFSCDTDGDDLEICKSVVKCDIRPKILVIEYNPTFPPFLYYANQRGRKQGSSLKAVIDDLSELEYDCVYATISNVILVDRRFNVGRIRPMNAFEAFRWDDVRFVCSDFEGQNYLATMDKIVDVAVNAWDQIPSVRLVTYPDRLLGYNEGKRKLRRMYHTGD